MRNIILILTLFTVFVAQSQSKTITKQKWVYDSYGDEMEGTTTYIASIKSNEILNFSFPYQNQRAQLHVRSDENVVITVSAQFTSTDYSYKSVKVKLDDGIPFNVEYTEPSDHSPGVIFINSIFDKLVNSKKVMVKALFYGDGYQTFTFDMTDFDKTKINLPEKEVMIQAPISKPQEKYKIKMNSNSYIYSDFMRTEVLNSVKKGDIFTCTGIEGNSYIIDKDGLKYIYVLDADPIFNK